MIFVLVMGIELRTLRLPGRCCASELVPGPENEFLRAFTWIWAPDSGLGQIPWAVDAVFDFQSFLL